MYIFIATLQWPHGEGISAILLAASTKHGRLQRWEFVLLTDATSPPPSATSNGIRALSLQVNLSSPSKETHSMATPSLDYLKRAFANVGVNDTLSCADKQETLFENRTRTENNTSIASWSYLGVFGDSVIRLESLLFRLSSAQRSSRNGLFACVL